MSAEKQIDKVALMFSKEVANDRPHSPERMRQSYVVVCDAATGGVFPATLIAPLKDQHKCSGVKLAEVESSKLIYFEDTWSGDCGETNIRGQMDDKGLSPEECRRVLKAYEADWATVMAERISAERPHWVAARMSQAQNFAVA
jgi:hypothetical protein